MRAPKLSPQNIFRRVDMSLNSINQLDIVCFVAKIQLSYLSRP